MQKMLGKFKGIFRGWLWAIQDRIERKEYGQQRSAIVRDVQNRLDRWDIVTDRLFRAAAYRLVRDGPEGWEGIGGLRQKFPDFADKFLGKPRAERTDLAGLYYKELSIYYTDKVGQAAPAWTRQLHRDLFLSELHNRLMRTSQLEEKDKFYINTERMSVTRTPPPLSSPEL